MQVIDFTEPVKENPYTNDIKALADLPEGKAGEFVFPAAEKVKHTRQISKAANGIDKTARIRVSEDVAGENGEELHRVVVTLTKRHVARRGEKATTTDEAVSPVADAPADAEVVAEVPAEATDEAHEAPTPRKRR